MTPKKDAPEWFKTFMTENFDPLMTKLTKIEKGVDRLEMSENPMAHEAIASIPVIGADTHEPTHRKGSTFTWFQFPDGRNAIVGAAHCVLSLVTDQPDLVFVELPESILELGVKCVHLVDPYHPSFINPLPTEKDLVVIEVSKAPDSTLTVPKYQRVSPHKTKGTRTSFVVGRGMDSAVTSRGGSVRVTTQEHSRGVLEFLLNLGEPGDSGTLLFVRQDDGTIVPIAIFVGVFNEGNYHRRGRGAILPPLDTLTALPVVTETGRLHRLRQNGISFTRGPFPMQQARVHLAETVPGALQLVDKGGNSLTGVFVGTNQRIVYNGTTDVLNMSGRPY